MSMSTVARLLVPKILWALVLTFAALSTGFAQQPPPSVAISFGVDTTIDDVGKIVRLVRAYLAKPDSSARSRSLWSVANEFDRRAGDVSGAQAYQGFPATIIGATSAGPGDSVYVVKILHASADAGRRISPLAVQRLYAVRERGAPYGFRLSNALPRMTATWERRSGGALTFYYAPGLRPDPRKIARAARFVDSVAKLFAVPPPQRLDVYVAHTMDEAHHAIGLDFSVEASGPGEGTGGRSLAAGIVLIGDAVVAEAYYHEYVHAVLNPTLRGRTYLWGEGVATWLGGSRGRSVSEMYALLRRYQESHPRLGLRELLRRQFEGEGGKEESEAVYATGALIANAVYRRQGISGVRALGALPDSDAVLAALPARLGLPRADDRAIDRWWRAEAAALAPRQ